MKDPTNDMLCLQDFDETVGDFYRLDQPNAPWGDYGDMLIHGMTDCDMRDSASPKLERTGPFVPPISFPGLGCIIVTDALKLELQSSGLTGFSFVPAIKSIIVPIDWHEWDLSADEPAFYPDDGEPESYILNGNHSAKLARQSPDLWRVVVALGATKTRVPTSEPYEEQIFIRAASWLGADFFRADTTLYNYVSFRARQWLLEHHPAWLTCKPAQIQ